MSNHPDRTSITAGIVLFLIIVLAVKAGIDTYTVIAWTWGGAGQGGANSTGYLITSGPLADITLATGLLLWLRANICHVGGRWPRGCWRWGHPVPGTPYHACHHHHPGSGHKHGEHITVRHIHTAHRQARLARGI